MTQLLLSPRATEDTRILGEAATRRGWEVTRLSGWRPPEVIGSGELAVIEANPAFGSGIYSGDADRILDVVAHTCRNRDEDNPAISQYLYPITLE